MIMKKNKKTLKERLKKVKNPFEHISTRDLLITLLSLLICVLIGFGCGFTCAKSCKSVSASADTILRTPGRPYGNDDSRTLYMFNFRLNTGELLTASFMIYKEYSPNYINSSHYLALANDNTISPYRYVTEQLHEYVSEEGYFGLEILPNATNIEYELYYTYTSNDEPNYFYYDWETMYNDYSTLIYSNLTNGGFTGKLSYFFTCGFGFGFVLENGSYYFVRLNYIPNSVSISNEIAAGIGNIYTYADIFGSANIDESYNNGFTDGFEEGAEIGLEAGRALGYEQGYEIGYANGYVVGNEDGYAQGVRVVLEDVTPWQHIVNGVNSFLSIEIFPNVRISLILSISFGVILLGFGIKIFLGG